jgi:alpha-L-fucosidase
VNGEGIYGTRPWDIAEEGPTKATEGTFAEFKPVVYTEKDIRFTSKGNVVYAFCLDVPKDQIISISSLGLNVNSKKIKSVELLGSSEKIKWVQMTNALIIDTPKAMPCDYAIGFKIVL